MLYVVYDLSVVLFVVFYYGMIYAKYIIMLWFIYVIAHSIDTNVVYICSFVLFIFYIDTILLMAMGLLSISVACTLYAYPSSSLLILLSILPYSTILPFCYFLIISYISDIILCIIVRFTDKWPCSWLRTLLPLY